MTSWIHWWIFKNILKRINTIPSETLPKNWKGGNTTKLIYEANITLIPMPEKDITKKENYKINIPKEY